MIFYLSLAILTLAVAYALVAIVGHFWSLRLIFPRPPVTYDLSSDYVQITAADGTKLATRHWSNPSARYTMLFLHGNYEDLGSIGEYLPRFVAAGYAVFALDYRRYGRSEGEPTEANTCADVQVAYDYLRTTLKVPDERIIIFGYSLGGGPGIELARVRPAAALILQGAFVSSYRVKTRFPIFPGDKFVNIRKVPELTMPVMVIHGTADRTVPFWHGQAIYAALTARKTKFFVEGGPHTGLAEYTGPRYEQELKAFTDSL